MVIGKPQVSDAAGQYYRSSADHWARMLRALPRVRIDRVVEARTRLREHRLDDERIIAETVDRLREALLEDCS